MIKEKVETFGVKILPTFHRLSLKNVRYEHISKRGLADIFFRGFGLISRGLGYAPQEDFRN